MKPRQIFKNIFIVLIAAASISQAFAAESEPWCQITLKTGWFGENGTINGTAKKLEVVRVSDVGECVSLARKELGEKFDCTHAFSGFVEKCTARKILFRFGDGSVVIKGKVKAGR